MAFTTMATMLVKPLPRNNNKKGYHQVMTKKVKDPNKSHNPSVKAKEEKIRQSTGHGVNSNPTIRTRELMFGVFVGPLG